MSFIQDNGIYTLTNVKGGTCLDLSGGDNTSIIGYGCHHGPNQCWIFERAGGAWVIKSVRNAKYLSVLGSGLHDGQRVIASDSPVVWRAEDELGVVGGVRLSPESNTNFCLDLSNYGDPTPGTPVELWGRWNGQNQVWKVQRAQ